MRKLTHQEIVDRQSAQITAKRIPLVVVLDGIRSLHNVGSVFRTADGAGVEKIWLCGITGYPPDSQIAKTALGAQDHVPWEHAFDTTTVIERYREQGYAIVLLEQCDQSVGYQTYKPDQPVCLVLGNEVEGVSEALMPLCDVAVDIDMAGFKNSLNVGVAFGVVVYHLRNCLRK